MLWVQASVEIIFAPATGGVQVDTTPVAQCPRSSRRPRRDLAGNLPFSKLAVQYFSALLPRIDAFYAPRSPVNDLLDQTR